MYDPVKPYYQTIYVDALGGIDVSAYDITTYDKMLDFSFYLAII
jgi:hypothetical protein